MKKIFLYAYDHVNLGDDLFIETLQNYTIKMGWHIYNMAVTS